ncbi:type I-C CRISPR-associated endonuclease Cas1c [uncultured Anaerofustis sp.]|uniref:type I-C CRISPR-associated endonuclease Cas1c n=1 Tax=uncultured Anaerofustis sp. TaxID=904996 RepID=UPI0025CF4FC9|nr:type I-C CRISPR-associated endonuclease Cas1c [uncultured Anaerofustis sp.]
MRKLLNTLYVQNPDAYLSLKNENIVVLLEDEEKFSIPLVNIENIVSFGYRGVSPALMGKCCENNIGLYFMSSNGKFLAKITGRTRGNSTTRMRQYELYKDKKWCLDFSKDIVATKIYNTRYVLNRSIRDNKEKVDVSRLIEVSDYIKNNISHVYDFEDIDALRGFEGIVARKYFEVFNDMILKKKDIFNIQGRNKRPPLDYVNCMLSYLYTILSFEFISAIETVGLDPSVGFFHEIRPGRNSLALDLIEPFRAYLVDRVVLSLINLGQIKKQHFEEKEGGAILMTDEGRTIILNAWQEKKKEILRHPNIDEKIEIGLIPFAEAQLLSRTIRERKESYPTFIVK